MNPRLAPALLALALLGACLASAAPARADDEFESDVSETQIVSAFVGTNVYIPSTVVIAGDREHKLSVLNTTDVPHGFAIAGLGIEVVLEPMVETPIALPKLEGGKIYRIHCQLHPAHRSGTLVVVPGED